MVTDIRQWLASLGLEDYIETFENNDLNLDLVSDLKDNDLKALGVSSLGHRKRLLRAIAALGDPDRVLADDQTVKSAATAKHVSHLAAPPGQAERRQLTVLFCDLVGSTELSRQLDPEDMHELMRRYQDAVSDAVTRFEGHIAKFLGDGVLAYFGWPHAHEDQAARAVNAGLEAIKATHTLSTGGINLDARVGIATGLVVVGELGGETNAIVGVTPSLAARLQGVAKPGTVVVSASTRDLLGSQLVCEDLGRIQLKGFPAPVAHWRVNDVQTAMSRFESRQRGAMTPFVNREEEVEILCRRWDRVKTGRGQVVLLSGEPGIGKSRLAQVLYEQISDEPHTRLRYQCSPLHTGSALYPIISHLEIAAGLSSHDTNQQKLEKLRLLVGEESESDGSTAHLFGKLLAIPDEHREGLQNLPSAQVKDSTLKGILGQLLGMAQRAPVLMIVEDLHWIDPTSQELLDLLIERIANVPILLLCTFRIEYTPPWIGQANVTTLHVNRLDSRQSAVMVEKLSGALGLPAPLAGAVLAKTDGVPLFLEELTKTVLESDFIRIEGGIRTFGGRIDTLALPSTLKDSLMARLDRLQSAKRVLPVGAAIGRMFSFKLLAAVLSLEEEVLQPILDQLVHAQLLFQRGQPPDVTYTFKHALVQDAAYETLLKSEMRKLHARIAVTLEKEFPEIASNNPEVIAQHHARAFDAEKAVESWRQAATLAIERSANVEAISHIETALEQNEKTTNADQRVETEIQLREMMCVPLEARSWGSDDIETNLNRLRELRELRGDEEELFSVLHGLCGTHLIGAKILLAKDFATKMLQIATRRDDATLLALSHHAHGMSDFFHGEFDSSIDHFQLTLRTYRPECASVIKKYYVADLCMVERCMMSWAYLLKGDTEKADWTMTDVTPLVEAQEHAFSKAYGLSILASFHQAKDDAAASLRYATTALQVSRENFLPYWEAWSHIVKGWAMVAAGDHDQGISELRDGLAKYAKTGSRQIVPYAQALLADAYLRVGRIIEGLGVIDDLETARPTNEVRFFDQQTAQIAAKLRAALDADRRDDFD